MIPAGHRGYATPKITTRKARPYPPAIAEMIDGWDGGDPFGSAWSMLEACHDVLGMDRTDLYGIVLDDGATVSGETAMLAGAVLEDRLTDDDLRLAYRVLDRYLDLCRLAGLGY